MGDTIWTRNLSIHYSDEPCKVQRLERVVSSIRNRNNVSFSAALKKLLDLGVESYLKNPDQTDPDLENWNQISKFLDQAKMEVAVKRDMAQAYRGLGPERFLTMAEEKGLDAEQALSDVGSYLPMLSKSSGMHDWILGALSDGEIHPAEKVVEDAVADKVLPDPEKAPKEFRRALGLFRKVASDLGASGGSRGEWQLKMPLN